MDVEEISGFSHRFPFQHRREVDFHVQKRQTTNKLGKRFSALLTDEADFFLICMCFVCWRVVNVQP